MSVRAGRGVGGLQPALQDLQQLLEVRDGSETTWRRVSVVFGTSFPAGISRHLQ